MSDANRLIPLTNDREPIGATKTLPEEKNRQRWNKKIINKIRKEKQIYTYR